MGRSLRVTPWALFCAVGMLWGCEEGEPGLTGEDVPAVEAPFGWLAQWGGGVEARDPSPHSEALAQQPAAKRLLGVWVIDVDALRARGRLPSFAGADRDAFLAWARDGELEFTGETIVSRRQDREPEQARYRVLSAAGERLILQVTDSGGVEEIATAEVSSQGLTLSLGEDDLQMPLRRK